MDCLICKTNTAKLHSTCNSRFFCDDCVNLDKKVTILCCSIRVGYTDHIIVEHGETCYYDLGHYDTCYYDLSHHNLNMHLFHISFCLPKLFSDEDISELAKGNLNKIKKFCKEILHFNHSYKGCYHNHNHDRYRYSYDPIIIDVDNIINCCISDTTKIYRTLTCINCDCMNFCENNPEISQIDLLHESKKIPSYVNDKLVDVLKAKLDLPLIEDYIFDDSNYTSNYTIDKHCSKYIDEGIKYIKDNYFAQRRINVKKFTDGDYSYYFDASNDYKGFICNSCKEKSSNVSN